MAFIELRNIEKTYTRAGGAGAESVRAVRDLSLAVERGEFVAIVGASGSGKSTLMNLLGLLDCPSSGMHLFDGQDVAGLGLDSLARLRNRKIGFVFQSFHLLPRVSALANVELPLLYTDREEIAGLGARALAAVGLSDRARHTPAELSGGQQQRVALARALVNEPDLVLADEPTGNLDSDSARGVMEILVKLHGAGRTIVVITHDPAVAAYSQRIVRLADGCIVADGPTATLSSAAPSARTAAATPVVPAGLLGLAAR